MARLNRKVLTQVQALNTDLEHEIDLFAARARGENALEAVMRIRALMEISGQLDTERLLALAVWLNSQMGTPDTAPSPPASPGPQGRAAKPSPSSRRPGSI